MNHKKNRLMAKPTSNTKPKSKEMNSSLNSPQPIILIVPTDDVQSTIEQISSSFRSTCEVAVQAQTSSFIPQTSTIGVGNELPQSYDFGGQYNYLQPQDSYYSTHPPGMEMGMNTGEAGYESYDPLLSDVCCPY
ncbi:unnamed protein product [Auanema sp. JU1783]|nr:unnamed protein product [Auanema sp. JU1783]